MKRIPNLVLKLLRVFTQDDVAAAQAGQFQQVESQELKLAAGAEHWTHQQTKAALISKENNLDSLGVINFQKAREEKLKIQLEEKNNEPRDVDLILNLKEDMVRGEQKLYRQTGYESYKRSAETRLLTNISRDENGKQKITFSKTQGILINKKQA